MSSPRSHAEAELMLKCTALSSGITLLLLVACPLCVNVTAVSARNRHTQYDTFPWAAWYNTQLLITLTPQGVVFSFLSFPFLMTPFCVL